MATLTGRDLAERRYEPIFPYFADHPNSFRVLTDDYVGTEEGTGVVHLAPGFGEEDQRVCEANGIELVVPVDDAGRFTADVPDWEGENVFDANPAVIKVLKDKGVVVRHDSYEHNYPHCWRTDTPIIYKAVRLLVRRGHRVPGPPGRAEPGDQLDPRPRPGRGLRPLAGGGPGLVDQPQPLLGLTHPGLAERRPRPPPHRRLRQPRRDRGRLRRASRRPAPAHRRRPRAPQPRRPHREVDDAPGPRGPGLLVRVRVDALRAGPLPVREPSSGSRSTSPPTSSSSTSPRPAAGSTRCTCCRRPCSTGRRSRT